MSPYLIISTQSTFVFVFLYDCKKLTIALIHKPRRYRSIIISKMIKKLHFSEKQKKSFFNDKKLLFYN